MDFSRNIVIIVSSFFLLVMIPCATSLAFNLTDIGPQDQNMEIITENGAYISSGGIQVTPDDINRSRQAGRAIYIRPLHLWDKASGELADFDTNFSFVIDSSRKEVYADGLTFFLAQNNSFNTAGGSIGLPINSTTFQAICPFVAVEFDSFWNSGWDPRNAANAPIDDHVGININSLTSVRYQKWLSSITYGRLCQAWIRYDSVSKNLGVYFTGFQNNAVVIQGVNYTIDLRNVLPEWVIFGFSAATGDIFEKNSVLSWTFNSSNLTSDENNPVKGKSRTGLVVGLVVGLPIGVRLLCFFVAIFAFLLWKKKKNREDEYVKMNKEFEMGTGPKRFSYQELARSTGDFADKEKLGEGGFGGVYRGFLKDSSTYVAVKRVSKSSKQGIKEYASEVQIISQLRHRNLVQLKGWCHEKRELLLVYEFMENGSLDLHLFNAERLLTWEVRYKIAQGLASALLYLHEEWKQCVLHRDIKSSNIMLDSDFNPKLGDFGLAKLVDHEKGSQTTMPGGTLGYMAPECFVTGKACKESDVYSFGVVALEIACGRKATEYPAPDRQIGLVEWVWELYGSGKLLEAADPRLGSDFVEQEIKHLITVGLWCAHPESSHRPLIRQATNVLISEAPLPDLPANMPKAAYLTPPTATLYGVSSIVARINNRS